MTPPVQPPVSKSVSLVFIKSHRVSHPLSNGSHHVTVGDGSLSVFV